MAVTRLKKEFVRLKKEPLPFINACPKEDNILEWHYLISGPPDTPYEGGSYHGIVLFSSEYPFKPPSIRMITPSGRFEPNTRLCLSMSDYHPETWNPMWSVSTILNGLLSFMLESEITTGSIETTTEVKIKLAKESLSYNRRNPVFVSLFEK